MLNNIKGNHCYLWMKSGLFVRPEILHTLAGCASRVRLKRTFALQIYRRIGILLGGRDSVEPQTFIVPI